MSGAPERLVADCVNDPEVESDEEKEREDHSDGDLNILLVHLRGCAGDCLANIYVIFNKFSTHLAKLFLELVMLNLNSY